MTYSFDPASAGVGTHTITYIITTAAGCMGSAMDNVEVFAAPVVSFTALADLSISAGTQTGLGGGTPTGGVYSGSGVTDDGNGMTYSFDPVVAGAGIHTLTYTFIDPNNGCTGSASDDVEVFEVTPSISRTDEDGDGIPDILDPCDCGDPQNMPVNGLLYYHDFITVVSNPNEMWEVTAITSGAMHELPIPSPLTAPVPLMDIGPGVLPGSRIYRIDFWTLNGEGFAVEVNRIGNPLPIPLTTGGTCADTTPPMFTTSCPAGITIECSEPIPAAPVLMATDDCGFPGSSSAPDVVFINEIHYDNTGSDVGEFIEVAGTAGIDLTGYSLVLYNGNGGALYNTVPLSGIIDDEGTNSGAISFAISGIQNGSPDGVALVDPMGTVIEFLSYEGIITATAGPANGMMSTNIGVSEPSSTPVGESLQLTGVYPMLTWTGPTTASPGDLNTGEMINFSGGGLTLGPIPVVAVETFVPGACANTGEVIYTLTVTDAAGNQATCTQTITVVDNIAPSFVESPLPTDVTVDCGAIPTAEVLSAIDNCGSVTPWINEFHYDNTGTDVGEFIEVAGAAGTDLSGYSLELYNGVNGTTYNSVSLSGIISDEGMGFGAIDFQLPVNGLQNGSPDGFALVGLGGVVLEFLSYEGTFMAVNGSAAGMSSTDVGVSEPSTTPVGVSLQLTGTGASGPDFIWTAPSAESPGILNTTQEIQGNLIAVLSEDDNTTFCDGGTITRTWNVEDDCGNMATAHVQTITVSPPVAPTLTPPTFPSSITCEAGDVFVAPSATFTNGIIGTCNISGSIPAIVNNAFDACGGSITVTYNDVDQCGNPLIAGPFIITVEPAPVPTISIPAYSSPISCVNAENYVPPTATYTNGLSGTCNISGTIQAGVDNTWDACGGTLVLHYFTVDQCGNQIALAPIIIDVQAAPLPTITPPTLPTSISCVDGETYMPPVATYDNGLQGACNLSGTTDVAVNRFFDACGGYLQVIYLGEDACGRSLTKNTTVITVEPAPAPTIAVPSFPVSLSCSDAGSYVAPFASYDNGMIGDCNISGLIESVISYNVDACNGGTMTITYDGVDDCGNVLSATPVVVQVDPAPAATLEAPKDVPATIYCWDAGLGYYPGNATYSNDESGFCENSGEIVGIVTEFWNNCDGGYIIYDYSGVDDCGNELTPAVIKVSVLPDTWAPVGGCAPLSETMTSIEDVPEPDELDYYLGQIAAGYDDEGCGEITVSVIDDSGAPVCDGNDFYERIYTVEISDACGNVAGECTITFSGSCSLDLCTMDQKFYGNPDAEINGQTSGAIIDLLITGGVNPIVIGDGADCGFMLDDLTCVQALLNTSGASISLPSGFMTDCFDVNNSLVNQMVVTILNIRYNETMNPAGQINFGGLLLSEACLNVPGFISNNLPANPTVSDLLQYANDFIECQCSSTCGEFQPNMAELTNLFWGLNSRFNNCNAPVPCGSDFADPTIGGQIQVTKNKTLELYPNPTKDFINLKVTDYIGLPAVIEIFDTRGAKLGEKTFQPIEVNTLEFDVHNFTSGLYWISIKVEGHDLITKKFVVR